MLEKQILALVVFFLRLNLGNLLFFFSLKLLLYFILVWMLDAIHTVGLYLFLSKWAWDSRGKAFQDVSDAHFSNTQKPCVL